MGKALYNHMSLVMNETFKLNGNYYTSVSLKQVLCGQVHLSIIRVVLGGLRESAFAS